MLKATHREYEALQWLFRNYNPHGLTYDSFLVYNGLDKRERTEGDDRLPVATLDCWLQWQVATTLDPAQLAADDSARIGRWFASDELDGVPVPTEPGIYGTDETLFIRLGHDQWLYAEAPIEGGP